MKKVLVTGGAGFIGANLIRLLLKRGFEVAVLDNLSTGRKEYFRGLTVDLIEADVLDAAMLRGLVPGFDGIVHLAAQTGVPASLEDPLHDHEVNVLGTLNLLEAMRMAKRGDRLAPRLVFASSNAPLGRQTPPASEEKAALPISPYGASKLAGEAYCLAYNGSWGLGTVALRFANVYGPYSRHKGSVVAQFLRDITDTGRITLDGDGRQTRDFIYVEDLCRAVLLALESDVSGEIFQIATGVETSILELASLIGEVMNQEIRMLHGPARAGDIGRSFSDVSKASRLLGWQPQVSIEEGIRRTAEWFAAERTASS